MLISSKGYAKQDGCEKMGYWDYYQYELGKRLPVYIVTVLYLVPGALVFIYVYSSFALRWEIALGLTIVYYVLILVLILLYFVKYKKKSLSELKKGFLDFLKLPTFFLDYSNDNRKYRK